jgi:NAD(P)-dependent dehydrogenase (short-subunit alcohol dehydrogenase family)
MAVALITGAGSGLGRVVARRFAAKGLGVALVGRRQSALEETATGLSDALVAPADITDPDQVSRALEACEARWGRLDVVVNCAALLADAPGGLSWPHFAQVLHTNVMGAAIVSEAAVERMKPGGVIVHIGSSRMDGPTPEALAYGASKAALAHLMASLAVRYAPRRVRVVGLAPGWLGGPAERVPAPLEAAADAIQFLASRGGALFQGVMLRMDGGEIVMGRR